MAFIVPILSAVGGLVGAVSQSSAQASAAEAQANANYYNAQVAQQNANAAMEAARADKEQQDRKNRLHLATVESKYLNSGVELEGSPLAILSDQAAQGALESEKILAKGKNQARNYLNQAQMYNYQAEVAKASDQSSSTMLGGVIGAAGTIGRSLL